MPRAYTATSATLMKVMACIHASKPVGAMFLIGMAARFRPITATTVPVTTGGMRRSIQCTAAPSSTSSTSMPAMGRDLWCFTLVACTMKPMTV